MARPASPTATEGAGYAYADKVGALCLLALLIRGHLGDSALGVVTKIQFAQRPAGWHFDDIVLTLDKLGVTRRAGLSIKSNSLIGQNGLKREIAELGWLQLASSPPFSEDTDVFVLAQPSVPDAVRSALDELIGWSITQEGGQTSDWVEQQDVGNSIKRKLLESASLGNSRDDPQRFFRAFRLFQFDLAGSNNQNLGRALDDCRNTLRVPTEHVAEQLWLTLCQIASEAKTTASTLDLPALLAKLTPHFRFREHPRVEGDLRKLTDYSKARHLGSVRCVIGEKLTIPTDTAQKQLAEALAGKSAVFFTGQSGTGKSVALKDFVEAAPGDDLRIYLSVHLDRVSPTFLANTLTLTHSIGVLLAECRQISVTLVIDQVDRVFSDEGLADLVELIALKSACPNLRFVFGCQSAEILKVASRLHSQLGPNQVGQVMFQPDEEAMFQAVLNVYPSLRNLVFRAELRPFLIRAKNLDLLVGRLGSLGELEGSAITSQGRFIEWFWTAYVDMGDNGMTRATAVRELADRQATLLVPSIAPSDITNAQALDSLRRDEIIVGDDERGIAFQHDLYGDWARVRSINAHRATLSSFLLGHGTNPLWLRAVRLWSAVLLETEGAKVWHEIFNSLSEDQGSGWLLRDALLDGLSLAAGSYEYLTELKEQLFDEKGKLLRRFLTRFLFAASGANEAVAGSLAGAEGERLTQLRSQFRIPQWYLWRPVVAFLCDNPAEAAQLAPQLSIEVFLPWLEGLPPGNYFGTEISEIVLAISEAFLEIPSYAHRDQEDYAFRLFRCLFLALTHLPEKAKVCILRAAGRTGEDRFADAEVVRGERFVKSYSVFSPSGRSRVLGPWRDGPVVEPNSSFREFVLFGGGAREAHAFSPSFLRQVLLACLIEPPMEEDPQRGLSGMFLERCTRLNDEQDFYPPLPSKGVYGLLFSIDSSFAIQFVLDLTDFASARWDEMRAQEGDESFITLKVGKEERNLIGGGHCYGWHRDGMHCPDALVTGLMSLEKFVCDRLSDGTGEPIVEQLVQSLHSTAILGILVSIGKKHPKLFADVLRFVHFNETVQWLDIEHACGNENHQMIAWNMKSDSERKVAREWHEMPHRRRTLKDHAPFVLSSRDGQREAKQACIRWSRLAKGALDERRGGLENLAVVYDRKNYEVRQSEDHVEVQCVLPPVMQSRAQEHLAEFERNFRPMTLAHKCRQVLNGSQEVGEHELQDMYEAAKAIATEDIPEAVHYKAEDAKCGVAAVLYLRHKDWLTQQSDIEKWCIETAVSTCLNPPVPGRFESEVSISEDQWCHFCAQLLPAIWADQPDCVDVRCSMANLIEDFRYRTVAYLAGPIFKLWESHPILYFQALQLHRQWCKETMRLREVERRSHYVDPEEEAPSESSDYPAIRAAFIDGSLTMELMPLPSPTLRPPKAVGRGRSRKRPRAVPKIDSMRMGCFASNLPDPSKTSSPGGREEVLTRWREHFDELITEISGRDDDDVDGSVDTYEGEWDIFSRFGWVVATLSQTEQPEHFLKAIVSITPYAEHLVECFFRGFFARLLNDPDARIRSHHNWSVAVDLYLGSKDRAEDVWTKSKHGWHDWAHWVVGNIDSLRNNSWKEEHGSFIASNRATYESWVRAMSKSSGNLSRCLRFLKMPAAKCIGPDAIVWIDEALSEAALENDRDRTIQQLGAFLEQIKGEVMALKPTRPEVFASYLNLLAILNKRNDRLAMQLMEDVATWR